MELKRNSELLFIANRYAGLNPDGAFTICDLFWSFLWGLFICVILYSLAGVFFFISVFPWLIALVASFEGLFVFLPHMIILPVLCFVGAVLTFFIWFSLNIDNGPVDLVKNYYDARNKKYCSFVDVVE